MELGGLAIYVTGSSSLMTQSCWPTQLQAAQPCTTPQDKQVQMQALTSISRRRIMVNLVLMLLKKVRRARIQTPVDLTIVQEAQQAMISLRKFGR